MRFVATHTRELLDGSVTLRLNPVGLHYVASRLEALHELEAVGAGAPVDYLRLLTSLKVVSAGPGRDPAPLSVPISPTRLSVPSSPTRLSVPSPAAFFLIKKDVIPGVWHKPPGIA